MTRTILLFTTARSAKSTRSVCRASGFVQVGFLDFIPQSRGRNRSVHRFCTTTPFAPREVFQRC